MGTSTVAAGDRRKVTTPAAEGRLVMVQSRAGDEDMDRRSSCKRQQCQRQAQLRFNRRLRSHDPSCPLR
jgi:hypothetical protein